jgi:peptidoglycan-associated lipoprotein
MQKRFYQLLALAFLLMPVSGFAQLADNEDVVVERHKTTKRADEYFEAKEYTVALEAYTKAYSKEKSRDQKQRISYNMAECYRFTGQCKRAGSYYLRAQKLGYGALASLGYAEMLQCQGEYEDAIVAFTDYKKLVPEDPRADVGINSCKQAAEWEEKGSLFSLDNAKDLNSKKSDYAIAFAGKRGKEELTLMISSMRDDATGRKEDGWLGQRFSDIFIIEGQKKKSRKKKKGKEANANDEIVWGDLEPMSEVINTKDHEGVLTFDSRGKTMYFTKCVKIKNTQMGCAIYTTKKIGQDWANPEPVVIALDSGASVGHPALSPDDKILYFAGELSDGKGGKDIYMTTYNRRAREWNTPESLNINTRGDELYPFIHGDGYLYFSSNGRAGMGGFDCFRVKLDDKGMPIGDVENMLSPINSEADDIALRWVPGDNTQKGFVVSNRKGTRGEHDIWYVTEWTKQFEVQGTVVSSKDGRPVKDVTIEVSDKSGNNFTVTTDSNGKFSISKGKLEENKAYKLNMSRKKYLNAVGDINTEGLSLNDYSRVKEERQYVKSFSLTLKMDPIEVPIVLPNVFFDLAKSELREESKVALDTVYSILVRNPTITIGLRSHTDYRDTDAKNEKLSLARAQSCVDYLIEKGIATDRLTAVGMGEKEPFKIPSDYKGYGADKFKSGDQLTEGFIKRLASADQEIANQINRRTDFKVLSDDYVPSTPVAGSEEAGLAPEKKNESPIGQTMTLTAKDRSLGKIAMQNGMNVVELKKLNAGLRGARPMPGMVIKITKNGDYSQFDEEHYQVQRGDVLRTIAKKTGTDLKSLRSMNGFKSDKDLIVGSWIQIK